MEKRREKKETGCMKILPGIVINVKVRVPFFISPLGQGCQMVCFRTKNPNLGKFWRALEWKMLVYFMAIWQCCGNLVHIFSIVLVYCTKKNLAILL
jgi:hypothetical protein